MGDSSPEYLERLTGGSVSVEEDNTPDSVGHANVTIKFYDGSELRACYWRIVGDDGTVVSSFDHGQRYGLPEPFNAKQVLKRLIEGQVVVDADLDRAVGDLHLSFANGTRLQVFGFTSYEIWELHLADGSVEYSNHLH